MHWLLLVIGLLLAVALYDLFQRKHAILRNFPIIGHFRYWLEAVGPEVRQYIVVSNDEERPFSRDQRRWVYSSSKKQNNYFGFGTDNDLELTANHLILKHSAFPLPAVHPGEPGYDPTYSVPCAKILGGSRGRKFAFRPSSVINISGMSFGSLGSAAVDSMNRGAGLCSCLHNTGEGGIAPYHLRGGDLVWQIGTGYFGCRAEDGNFSKDRFLATLARAPVRAIEIKLSQGAKPGLGGVLPGAKVTPEIAAIRGIPLGKDCISPSYHRAFDGVEGLIEFVEELSEACGLPVGIKSAVGQLEFWNALASKMSESGRGPDFIAIDGGEGGTGAGPLVFADHVAQPFKIGFSQVYSIFAEHGLHEDVVFIGSGRLGFPADAMLAFALGCDLINVGREAMMAVGCIQAQRCHTGHCPTGVATHNKWLMRGLDPELKAARLANYIVTLRKELLQLSHACGVRHPALITLEHFTVLDDQFGSRDAADVFGYPAGRGLPSEADRRFVGTISAVS